MRVACTVSLNVSTQAPCGQTAPHRSSRTLPSVAWASAATARKADVLASMSSSVRRPSHSEPSSEQPPLPPGDRMHEEVRPIVPDGMLTDKVLIVTGASQGIGEVAAYGFARAGASVVLAARRG